MDVTSLAASLIAARTAQVQVAMAATMMRMNAQAEASVVELVNAAQTNMDRLANVAAGVGTSLDISA
jgi:hypothetical protein